MNKPTAEPRESISDRSPPDSETNKAGDKVGATGIRKPYRPPQVRKRRSLSQATLVSGGGVSATLVGGTS